MSANPQKIPGVGFAPLSWEAIWAKNGSPVDPYSGRPQQIRRVPIDRSAPDPYRGKVYQEHGDRAVENWGDFVRMFMGGDATIDDGHEMIGESNERWGENAHALMEAFRKGHPQIKGTPETHTGIPTLLEMDLLRATTYKNEGVYRVRVGGSLPTPTPKPAPAPVPPPPQPPPAPPPEPPPAVELQPVPAEVLRTAEEMGSWQGEIGGGKRRRLREVARFLQSVEGYKPKA